MRCHEIREQTIMSVDTKGGAFVQYPHAHLPRVYDESQHVRGGNMCIVVDGEYRLFLHEFDRLRRLIPRGVARQWLHNRFGYGDVAEAIIKLLDEKFGHRQTVIE